MRIAISGATDFIGSCLSAYLIEQGYEVEPLNRGSFNREAEVQLMASISNVDAVINLAGAPINRRWTSDYKQMLYDSRIIPTRMLVNAVNQTDRVKLFISVSAVGYYPSDGCYDEFQSVKGESFLSGLCDAWESEAWRVKQTVRLSITRLGIVLSRYGGAFPQLSRSLRMGIAAVVASGKQAFTWISLTDLMEAMDFIIRHTDLKGVFNFVTPEQVTYAEFMQALARHDHIFMKVKVPRFVFRILYGEGAEFITCGQCVKPVRLTEAGFRFKYPGVSGFLNDL